jgi:hypothetical protein
MESPRISEQQTSRLAGQLWECTDDGHPRKSGTELAETVKSLGSLSFSIERLEHSRIGETVQVGLTYWRRVE